MRRHLYLDELQRIHDRVETLLGHAVSESAEVAAGGLGEADPLAQALWSPAVDLSETAEAFHLAAELPGMTRESIVLEVLGRKLVLAGDRKSGVEGGSFLRMERQTGPFRRVFDLPAAVDEEAIEALYERGVLRVKLPKQRGA